MPQIMKVDEPHRSLEHHILHVIMGLQHNIQGLNNRTVRDRTMR
jgi:hypothetical protein